MRSVLDSGFDGERRITVLELHDVQWRLHDQRLRHGRQRPLRLRGDRAPRPSPSSDSLGNKGCNSIDIFVGPESGPEPGPSHVWSFETCLQRGAKKFKRVRICRLPPTHQPRAANAQPISPDGTCVTELSLIFFAPRCRVGAALLVVGRLT